MEQDRLDGNSKRSRGLNAALAALLPPLQRRWHTIVFVVLTLIGADTLFLLAHRGVRSVMAGTEWSSGESSFYQASVLLHSLIGYILALLLLIFAALHVPAMIRRIHGRWLLVGCGALIIGSYVFLLYSGTFFFLHAKSAGNAWLYWSHMAVSGGFILIYVAHRVLAERRPQAWPVGALFATAGAVAAVMVVADVGSRALTAQRAAALRAEVAAASVRPMMADKLGFSPASGIDPAAPFFPSPVMLASGRKQIDADSIIGVSEPDLEAEVRAEVDKRGYARTRLIGAEGCARCHADITAQWEQSAHRFSSFNNPFYVASLRPLRANTSEPNVFLQQHMEAYGIQDVGSGMIKSQWCGGCHDPALLFEGKMRKEIDMGEVKAQAGLTCLACHLIKDVPTHTGSGRFVWNDVFKDPYLFSSTTNVAATQVHDLYLKANPEQHKQDMLKPVFREAQFCSACHKVSLEPPLNEYHYVRGQDEYDAWHDSGLPLNAARTFYQPKEASVCQTCHMPLEPATLGDVAAKDGKVKSHRFNGANTGLPFLRGDQDMIKRTEEYMRGKLRIAFAGLRSGDQAALATENMDASLTVPAGKSPELHVVVRNLGVGHTFPGGTNDSNQGWVEITVTDDHGRPLLRGGQHDELGTVADNTRIYNVVFVDRNSNRIAKRNAQDIATPIYVAVIPPGTADLVRFRLPLEQIPSDVRTLKVEARLMWRKFNPTFSEFVRNSEPKVFAEVGPELPISVLASATAELSIEPNPAGSVFSLHAQTPVVPTDQRHLVTHDYGIGLLLQGDSVIGRQVLEGLAARHPECDNCVRTLARQYLTDRDYPKARATLDQHEERWPGHPQGAWLWAGVLRGEGNDDEAIKALNRVVQAYPRDREAWRLMTEINYRSGRFQAALDTSARVLDIDPEDTTAHYYAMLAKRALGDEAGSKHEQTVYKYYQRDESAQQMTLDFRQRDPAANFASQSIRVYDLR